MAIVLTQPGIHSGSVQPMPLRLQPPRFTGLGANSRMSSGTSQYSSQIPSALSFPGIDVVGAKSVRPLINEPPVSRMTTPLGVLESAAPSPLPLVRQQSASTPQSVVMLGWRSAFFMSFSWHQPCVWLTLIFAGPCEASRLWALRHLKPRVGHVASV